MKKTKTKTNRKPYKKPITKQNLQDALDFVFIDLETVVVTMTQDWTTLSTLKL